MRQLKREYMTIEEQEVMRQLDSLDAEIDNLHQASSTEADVSRAIALHQQASLLLIKRNTIYDRRIRNYPSILDYSVEILR